MNCIVYTLARYRINNYIVYINCDDINYNDILYLIIIVNRYKISNSSNIKDV